MIKELLYKFMYLVENRQIDIYNEFSFQHELGIFLRSHLGDYKVQFERNTKHFGILDTVKHEIDIVVFNDNEKHAIELKYPLNGQYPEQMYLFAKDIAFMEQLVEAGFDGAYCVTLVNDRNFYSGKKTDGIYSYFRANGSVCGVIAKPTGKSKETIELKKSYSIKWEGLMEKMKYYIVDINEGV